MAKYEIRINVHAGLLESQEYGLTTKIIITQKLFCHPEEEKIYTIINSIHTSPFQKVYIVDSCCYFVFTFLCKVKSLTTGGVGSNCLEYQLCILGKTHCTRV